MTTKSSSYVISPGYQRVVVWSCNPKTRRRECVTTIRPNKDLDRRGRHAAVCSGLAHFNIPLPAYEPLKNEKP